MQLKDFLVSIHGSHSGQFVFDNEIQSIDGDLTHMILLCNDGAGISSPTHEVVMIVE